MSRRISEPRFAVLAVTLSLAGATLFLFVFGGLGWWLDGLYLVGLGMVLGQSVGIAVSDWILRRRNCEGPAVLGNAVGIVVMVMVWLFLPEDLVTIVGHIARAFVGGIVGLVMAFATKPYPDRGQSLHSDPERAEPSRPAAH